MRGVYKDVAKVGSISTILYTLTEREMDNTEENTARLLDAINAGNAEEVRYVLESFALDINVDISRISEYAAVEIPCVDVDIVNSSRDVEPERLLGCALLQKDISICRMILEYSDSITLTDKDAVICIYHSTRQVHRLVTRRFPALMVNRRLTLSARGANFSLENFFPLLCWTYTPLHAVLLSFLSHRDASMYLGNKYIPRQLHKMRFLIRRGALLDGVSYPSLPVLGQLLLLGELQLARVLLDARILNFSDAICNTYLRRLITLQLKNSIMFLVHDRACRRFKISSPDAGQQLLTAPHFLRRLNPYECQKWTEFIVHNQFVLSPIRYFVRFADTASRLYNLFRAGVYLSDPMGHVGDMDQSLPVVKDVADFLVQSKSPFRLDFLCRQAVKQALGPTEHYSKIKSLLHYSHDINVPKPVLRFLAVYKYTVKGKLVNGNDWVYPISWRRAPVRYRPTNF